MTNKDFVRTILKEIGFDKRKFFFIFGLVIVGFSVYLLWTQFGSSEAAIDYTDMSSFSVQQRTMKIELASDGTVLIEGVKKNKALKFYQNYDEFRLLVYDSPGEYIGSFRATLKLPSNPSNADIRPIIYAVHGVGSSQTYMPDQNTIVYAIDDISPQATLTLVADLPKGMITPNLTQNIIYNLSNLPVQIWLYIAIGLPGIAFIMMFFMVIRRRSDQIFVSKGELGSPPDALSPALAGVLVDGVVGAREIAATLIDLARRGYIVIINKGGGNFTFGAKKAGDFNIMSGLTDYERVLLNKIFLPQSLKSTLSDVEMRIGRHIFSRKIAQFYLDVYNQATTYGYFVKNPAKVHLGWKYTGVTLFFLSFFGFIMSAIWGIEPKYNLIFWVGGMIAAVVIIRMSPFMPARSRKGSQELSQWLAFREYLIDRRPVAGVESMQGKFEEYLPYALVLGGEVEWAKRFAREPFIKPEWYDSRDRVITLENFAQELFPLIGYVANNLARSHEPTVE